VNELCLIFLAHPTLLVYDFLTEFSCFFWRVPILCEISFFFAVTRFSYEIDAYEIDVHEISLWFCMYKLGGSLAGGVIVGRGDECKLGGGGW
jgi:hypothetical protein